MLIQCSADRTALINYTTEHDGRFVYHAVDEPGTTTRQWWFGLQLDRSETGISRALDKTRGPLANYLGDNIDEALACPAFPEDDPGFNTKFDQRSAHFGINGSIVPPFIIERHAESMTSLSRASCSALLMHCTKISSLMPLTSLIQ